MRKNVARTQGGIVLAWVALAAQVLAFVLDIRHDNGLASLLALPVMLICALASAGAARVRWFHASSVGVRRESGLRLAVSVLLLCLIVGTEFREYWQQYREWSGMRARWR